MKDFKNSTIISSGGECRVFKNEEGRNMGIVSPGYILNSSATDIYYFLQDMRSYGEVLNYIKSRYIGMQNYEDKLQMLLNVFYERNIIKVSDATDKEGEICKYMENDLYEKYKITPITQIDMVVTTNCNFRCKHCFIKDESYEEINKMNIEDWKNVVDKLYLQGLSSVIVTGGEPLVYEYLPELLEYLDSKNINIQLLTNGYLINEKFIEKIKDIKNIIVQVSLDGSNKDSNNHQRNKSDAFQQTTSNIKLLREANIPVIVAMVLNQKNITDIFNESMFKLCDSLNVNYLGITPTVINTGKALINIENFLTAKQSLEAIKFIQNIIKDKKYSVDITISAPPALTEEKSLSKIKSERPRCRRGSNSFSVRPNGDICVCSDFMELGFTEYELGNIFNTDIKEISKKLSKISEKKNNSFSEIKGICSICTELKYCGGACRADAYANYDDINAPYSLCQNLYEKGLFPLEKLNLKAKYKEF